MVYFARRSTACFVGLVAAVVAFLSSCCISNAGPVHMTYHWHMQQPIYWPARSKNNPLTYQKAYESLQLQSSQGGHPRNDIDSIFGKADRVADYQHYPSDAIDSCSSYPDMGAQVSFSGCLIENINSLAAANHDGYSEGWNAKYTASRQQTTSGGFPKLDLVSFTYHHALLPLADQASIAKEIAIHKVIYPKTWGTGGANYSKGFFPAEMAFTERAIPTLVEAGIEWVIVPNNHISRSCKGYPYSPSGDNNDPPNPADQVNPSQDYYFEMSISRGCRPNNAYPFSFKPHYAQYVDPTTGKTSKIIVVPAAMAMSWQDGYECYSSSDMQNLASHSSEATLVLMAHDGDNAFGGGYSYYNQCVKNLVDGAEAAGIEATTIQQFLANNPVAEDDIVHVEDGAWVNADGDFGAPQCLNWNYPLLPEHQAYPGQFDIPNGWAMKERNWAIITAAQNLVETAEQVVGGVDVNQIQEPTSSATNAELAWHFFLPSLTSGYMYYGSSLDLPVKPTVACNIAVEYAQKAIAGSTAKDLTPPTIWTPQRLPWNPGGYGMGSLYGYKYTPMNTSFYVWTFVSDASGVHSVNLMWRQDADGFNPIHDIANEVYEPELLGLSGVGSWNKVAMTGRSFPKGNFYNESIDLTCNATAEVCLPLEIADEYYVQLKGMSGLLDYYVEAVDNNGNVKQSDIYHVFVNSTSVDLASTGGFATANLRSHGANAGPSPKTTHADDAQRTTSTAALSMK